MKNVLRIVLGLVVFGASNISAMQSKVGTKLDAREIVNQLIPEQGLKIGESFVLSKDVEFDVSGGVRLAPLQGPILGDDIIAPDSVLKNISVKLQDVKNKRLVFKREVQPTDDIGTVNIMEGDAAKRDAQGNKLKRLISMKLGRGNDVVAFSLVDHLNAIDVGIIKMVDGKVQDTSTMYDINTGAIIDDGSDVFAKFTRHVEGKNVGPDSGEIGKRTAPMVLKELQESNAFKAIQDYLSKLKPMNGMGPRFSPDGAKIATYDREEGETYLYKVQDQSRIGQPMDGSFPQFSPDGTKIAISDGGETYLYKVQDQSRIGQPMDGTDPRFSPDGTKIATYDREEGETYLYKVQDQSRIGQPMDGWGGPVFSPDGTKIATYDREEGETYLYNVQDQSRIGQPMDGTDPVFSPDGTKIATGYEGETYLYKAQHQSRIGQPMDGTDPVFSPDGTKIATHNDVITYLYKAQHQSRIGQTMDGWGPVFSPDGTKIALSVYDESKTYLYKVQGQSRIGQTMDGRELVFSPDGTKIATHDNEEGEAYLYSMDWFNYLAKINSVKQLKLLEAFGYAILRSEQRGKITEKIEKVVQEMKEQMERLKVYYFIELTEKPGSIGNVKIKLSPEQQQTFKEFPKWIQEALTPYVYEEKEGEPAPRRLRVE